MMRPMQGGAADRVSQGTHDPRVVARLARVSRLGAWTLVGTGALVITSWIFDVSLSDFVTPGLVSMKANTAVAIALIGLALDGWHARRNSRLVRGLAGLAALTGALSLAERAFDWQLGIDELLFRDRSVPPTGRPGLMASNTAAAVIALALGVLLLNARPRRSIRISDGFALASGLIAFVALLGYLYGADSLYSVSAYSTIAPQSAAVLAAGAVAVLCAAPETGLAGMVSSQGPSGVLVRRLVPAIVVLPVALGAACVEGERRGLYSGELGAALLVAANVLCFVAIVLWTARELARADSASRSAERRFARLAEVGLFGVIVVNTSRKVLEMNDAFLRMIGQSRDDAMSGKLTNDDVNLPEWQAADAHAASELFGKGVAQLYEKEYKRKDGSRVPALVSAAMIDSETCIVCVLDLTEKKRAEAALRAAEEQLHHSQKMEAVGRLAGGIAHDFNNLLSVILGYAEMLQSELRTVDPRREELEEIVKAGNRATELTRQLLAVGRRQVLSPRALDLNDVVRGLEGMIGRIIGEDVELCYRLESRDKVLVDRGQLEQVLMNLVVNARDAMPKGGRLLLETADVELGANEVSECAGLAPGAHIVLRVTDTGEGMDAATQARVFEPFFTTKGHGKGTGLGLSTVFGIVKQSGGDVRVESVVGHGSRFSIYLPRTERLPSSLPPECGDRALRGSETILLVEDEEQVRAVTKRILSEHGYRVLDAESAAEALLVAERFDGTIDLLLTDVVMPKTSGRELAQCLSGRIPRLKTIFMSGYTDDAVVRHGVLNAEVAFIQKPITTKVLLTRVRELLDARASS
jgi:PAS domain S-box-containing protein